MGSLFFVNHLQAFLLFDTPSPIFTTSPLLLLSLLFLTLVVVVHINSKSKKKTWPPSPPTLPLMGNLHQLGKGGNFLAALTDLAKSYGPVMTVWMGTTPLVVLTGQTAIWEALVSQASNFAGRPPPYSRQFTSAGFKTMVSSPHNDHWIKLRKVLHNNVLSPFHIASQSSSHHRNVNNLITKLAEEMKANNGGVRPFYHLKIMAINFISPLCFGPDFEDECFAKKLEELISQDIWLRREGDMVLNALPLTRYFIPSSAKVDKQWKVLRDAVLELLLPLVRYARSYGGYFQQTAPTCFLNCLLSIGEEEAKENKLSDQEIVFCLYELFLLAVDSTSTAIEWALAYLINHPHIQEKAYQQVNEVCGGEKSSVRLEELGKLPYLSAVAKETMRKEAIAPLAVIHQTAQDSKVMGINIPAKSQVIFNLHSVSNDPALWTEPDAFVPERFIGKVDSDKVRMSYLPFGAGRRICAGMDVANVHVPITLANLLKKFQWMCAKEGSPPDLTRDIPSVLMCMKYPLQARIICR